MTNLEGKKYLVCPGRVKSINDCDTHYISAHSLMRLYGVNPAECVIYRPDRHPPSMYERLRSQMIVLAPRFDGIYTLAGHK